MNGETKTTVLTWFAKGVFKNLADRINDETNTLNGYEDRIWNLSSDDFWRQVKFETGIGIDGFEPGERALMIQAVREAWIEATKQGYGRGTPEDAEERFKA